MACRSWCCSIICIVVSLARSDTLAPITTLVIQAETGKVYEGGVNDTNQVIFQFDDIDESDLFGNSALRVLSSAPHAGSQFPLAVVVRQQRYVLSWELPLVIGSHEYGFVNRTLCSPSGDTNRRVTVSVSTSSTSELSFAIAIYWQPDFALKLDKEYEVRTSPSAPIFHRFDWPDDDADVNQALLKLESPDDVCVVLSAQNASCPVHDMDLNVKFEGFYQMADKLAGLAITKDVFPNGLFIVLVVKSDDSACHERNALYDGSLRLGPKPDRAKLVNLKILSRLPFSQYLLATLGALGMFLGMYALVILISCFVAVKRSQQRNSPSPPPALGGAAGDAPEDISAAVEVHVDADEIIALESHHQEQQDDSSLDETDMDMLLDIEWDKEIFRTKKFPFVSDLSRKSWKVLNKKLSLYHWNLWTIAVFYSLPVVQLMLTYQKVTKSTGNLDLCYYNFLCANPLGVISDFNHVYSNIGYVMLGFLFMAVTWFKELGNGGRHLVFASGNVQLLNEPRYGIPQHYGMFYAMGFALIMEGVMSGCYHVCPNHTNFQFDTAFMYTISILILLKIYQIRHPDITANAYTAFGILALVIFVGVVGVINGTVGFWILFTALHVVTCLLLSLQVYYMGRFKINAGMFKRLWLTCNSEIRAIIGGHWVQVLKPVYPDRMVLLLVMNAFNWGLSAYGIVRIAEAGGDFAGFLVAIFITNVMLYTSFYIVMKLRHGERILFQPAIYIVLSTFSWAGAMYFFFNKSTTWNLSPAQSKHYNKECVLFFFYDNHDIWHFLSATSLFLSFMILLTLDDDLKTVLREKIPVF